MKILIIAFHFYEKLDSITYLATHALGNQLLTIL